MKPGQVWVNKHYTAHRVTITNWDFDTQTVLVEGARAACKVAEFYSGFYPMEYCRSCAAEYKWPAPGTTEWVHCYRCESTEHGYKVTV